MSVCLVFDIVTVYVIGVMVLHYICFIQICEIEMLYIKWNGYTTVIFVENSVNPRVSPLVWKCLSYSAHWNLQNVSVLWQFPVCSRAARLQYRIQDGMWHLSSDHFYSHHAPGDFLQRTQKKENYFYILKHVWWGSLPRLFFWATLNSSFLHNVRVYPPALQKG